MDHADIELMKAVPGLHKVRMKNNDHLLFVASVDGELYGLVPDNKLSDEGWHKDAVWGGCLASGAIVTKAQLDEIRKVA